VEVLSVDVTVVIPDAIVVQTVLFLTIIMVVATDVQTFMVYLLNLIAVIVVEEALDAILEPVVLQVVVVSLAKPAYVDN
jgi:hypothetical protein